MTVYYVDDGGVPPGDATDGTTWAKAYTSLSALDDAVALAAGDIVYIGHNSVDQYTHSAARTITGATTGVPITIISATQGSNPPTYAAGTANQVDTTEGAYDFTFLGGFSIYGVQFAPGRRMGLSGGGTDSVCNFYDCKIIVPAGEYCQPSNAGTAGYFKNLTIDLTADGTTTRTNVVIQNIGYSRFEFENIIFVNAGYRTGAVFSGNGFSGVLEITACDFSGFTNGTLCELFDNNNNAMRIVCSNCLTAATWAPATSGIANVAGKMMLTNVGPADAPTYCYSNDAYGILVSSSSIYRTGGATVEGDACSWLITTTANCAEGAPFYTPWIYGTVSSTGSKTFDLYITNDTADLTDAEAWLQVEYLSTSDEAIWALATDQRNTITTTSVNQTDDTSSTWNGSGPSFTYKQKLSVTATIGETGQFRARVAVGKASITGSSYFYIDPKITVS